MRSVPDLALACALLFLSVPLVGADAPPDIPDPFGLGPRLALLDVLHTKYGVETKTDATYDELVALYWQTVRKQAAPAGDKLDDNSQNADEAAQTRDRIARLRAVLRDEFHDVMPDGTSEDALAAELHRLRDARQQDAIEKADAEAKAEARPDPQPGEDAGDAPAAAAPPPAAAGAAAADAPPATTVVTYITDISTKLKAIPQHPPTTWPNNMGEISDERLDGLTFHPLARGVSNGISVPVEKYVCPPPAGVEYWCTFFDQPTPSTYIIRWHRLFWCEEEGGYEAGQPAELVWQREDQLYQVIINRLLDGLGSNLRGSAWFNRVRDLGTVDPTDQTLGTLAHNAAAEFGFRAEDFLRLAANDSALRKQDAALTAAATQFENAQIRAIDHPGTDTSQVEADRAVCIALTPPLVPLHLERRAVLDQLMAGFLAAHANMPATPAAVPVAKEPATADAATASKAWHEKVAQELRMIQDMPLEPSLDWPVAVGGKAPVQVDPATSDGHEYRIHDDAGDTFSASLPPFQTGVTVFQRQVLDQVQSNCFWVQLNHVAETGRWNWRPPFDEIWEFEDSAFRGMLTDLLFGPGNNRANADAHWMMVYNLSRNSRYGGAEPGIEPLKTMTTDERFVKQCHDTAVLDGCPDLIAQMESIEFGYRLGLDDIGGKAYAAVDAAAGVNGDLASAIAEGQAFARTTMPLHHDLRALIDQMAKSFGPPEHPVDYRSSTFKRFGEK
jgi:hypothetical protein